MGQVAMANVTRGVAAELQSTYHRFGHRAGAGA